MVEDQISIYDAIRRNIEENARKAQAAASDFGKRIGVYDPGEMARTAEQRSRRALDIVDDRPTSPGGITPTEARPTSPGNNVLDAPSGPRDPALRLTDPGVNVSQNYQAGRPTTPGDSLQRTRQAARVADPEFARATEPFVPGTQQARLAEARPTTIDRTPFAERPTVQGRTPFAERATVQGESMLARSGTPTLIDEAQQLKKALKASEALPGRDQAMSLLDDVISRAQTSRGGRMAAAVMNAVKAMPVVQRAAPLLAGGARAAGRLAGPAAIAGAAYDAYQMGSALESTQDPLEQLRYLYKQQGSQPLKIGRGGVSRAAMDKLMRENEIAFLDAIDQGILDVSVGRELAGAPSMRSSDKPQSVQLDDIAITADKPSRSVQESTPAKVTRGASKPARGGASGVLRQGARGDAVGDFQKKLSALGSLTPGVEFDLGETGADSIFGSKTKSAVEAFQRFAGIEDDGVIGPDTLDAMDKALAAAIEKKSSALSARSTPAAPTAPEPELIDMEEFSDEKIDEAVGDPIDPPKKDFRRAPEMDYEALDLDEEVRPSAFPLFRRRRSRR